MPPSNQRSHAGVAITCRQPETRSLAIQVLDRLQSAKTRAHGPLGIIGVGERSSEYGHDRVADEFLHGPPEPFRSALTS